MRHPIVSFNAGELTEQVDARSDVAKYSSGCRVLENMIPRSYGSATRRPGFKYVDDANSVSTISRMIDFEYSDSIAYQIEFSALKCRFFFGGETLQSAGVDVTLVTPYLAEDLYSLQYKQANDVMWLVHPDYAPRKLTRTSATAFSISTITFDKGPFLPRNDLENADGYTLTPSVTTGSGTLTSSNVANPAFEAGHIGALFKLRQPRVDTIVSGSLAATGVIGSAINVKGPFTFNTSGTWTATPTLQRNENSAGWENFRSWPGVNNRQVQFSDTETEDNVQYRINITSYTSGTINADLTVDTSTQDGICRIDSITSTTIANMTVVAELASTDATIRWYEGAWSGVQGYPTSFTFFEDRAVYAFTANNPQTVWLGETGAYEDFEAGTNDNSSFSLTANSEKRNAGRWITSTEALIFGTIGGEWVIRASNFEQALTPTNFSMKPHTFIGSNTVQPIQVGGTILFVNRNGRKLYELSFPDSGAKMVAVDLTALAEHITKSGITSMALQKRPDSIVWMTLANGNLPTMTYEREQDVVAFALHPLPGTSALAKSVSVIPGSAEDEVWINTTRTVDGATAQFIEQGQLRDWGSDDEDAFMADAGIKYDSTATTTITGLDHLEGEIVKVYADGAMQASKIVASGQITIESASVAVVGLAPTFKLKPMRADAEERGGSTQGSIKKISEIVFSFLKSGQVQYGRDEDNLLSIPWRGTESLGSPPALFTGDKTVVFNGGYDPQDSVLVMGDSLVPCTLRAIILRSERTGR
jgi:hypothetical protein